LCAGAASSAKRSPPTEAHSGKQPEQGNGQQEQTLYPMNHV
jgi:hypothetical protein